MIKLEEIYQKHWENEFKELSFNSVSGQRNYIYSAMKEYAEHYAKKCLQMAIVNVRFQYGEVDVEGSTHKEIVDLDYKKTFCFKLPKHE